MKFSAFPNRLLTAIPISSMKSRNRKQRSIGNGWPPQGKKYGGGLTIKLENRLISCITLFRDEMNGPLSDRELYILDLFIGHMESIIGYLLIEQQNRFMDFKTMQAYQKLSGREKEIIPYVLKGYSNDDLSEIFYISSSTAKKHVYSILSKFQVSSRGELIKLIASQE